MRSAYLWNVYAQTRPATIDIDGGRVYSLITHGKVVYLTQAERVRLDLLMRAGVLLMFSDIRIHLNLAKKKR
jgi:hypothetical protein